MKSEGRRRGLRFRRLALALCLAAQMSCGGLLSRDGGGDAESGRPAPHFRPGFNLFSPEQDVELGRMSAEEITRQVPLLNDAPTVEYVRQLGARLAARAPGHSFPYQFAVIATRDINAFALPGGFVFVNAGAITAAKTEGELAGVIAHEISHVALRHGTNQASKAYVAQKGIGILGSVFGDGELGSVVGALGGAGANMIFLKFGRTAETQADLEGARVMAASGYDPRDMAKFFETLNEQGGRRAPEMLSDHPDPGNRVARINELLPSLQLAPKPVHDSQEFKQVKARLAGGTIATAKEAARIGPRDPNDIEPGTRPAPPAAETREFRAGDGSFALRYPANWDALGVEGDDTNRIFAPKGAYGERDNSVFATHGIFAGVVAPQARDLGAANLAFVRQQIEANPDFRPRREPERVESGGRVWYRTLVAGPSAVTGVVELDVIYTTAAADGRLFYLITMAPEDEFEAYQPSFEQIIASLRLAS
ncbi:MAG: M48 family metallopeptidase [Acidobacteria bacterium]|nr:M48 family metallopeptidase [Acidobacteriota bacterium]